MVNLGNTLFARSIARREAELERKRQEDARAGEVLRQAQGEIEDAKDRQFERQMKQSQLEGQYREQLGMPQAQRPENAAVARALGLGEMGGRLARQQQEQATGFKEREMGLREAQRGYQVEDRDYAARERRLASGMGRGHDVDMLGRGHQNALELIKARGRQQRALSSQQQRAKMAAGPSPDMAIKQMKHARSFVGDWVRTALQGTGATVTNTANGMMQITMGASPKSAEAKQRLDYVVMVNDMLSGLQRPEEVQQLAQAVSMRYSPEQLVQLHAKMMQQYQPDFQGIPIQAPGYTQTSGAGGGTGDVGRRAEMLRRLRDRNTAGAGATNAID